MSETEGIVLSPQRRSFITGCQVSKDTSSNNSNKETSVGPNDRGDPRDRDSRDPGASKPNSNASESLRPDPISTRRVGSGNLFTFLKTRLKVAYGDRLALRALVSPMVWYKF